ncbi:hypothetical protein C0989_011600 [Termitomyces sp. Mn162]|nr:hypothetical protein C0989_011600 [Termitomyces sp. Mn162]
MPALGNSDTSPANPNGPLANSNVFFAAANTSPGSPEPLEPSPAVPDSVICHQPIMTTSGQPAFPTDPIKISTQPTL